MTLEEANKTLTHQFNEIGKKVVELNEVMAQKQKLHSLNQFETTIKQGLEEIVHDIKKHLGNG